MNCFDLGSFVYGAAGFFRRQLPEGSNATETENRLVMDRPRSPWIPSFLRAQSKHAGGHSRLSETSATAQDVGSGQRRDDAAGSEREITELKQAIAFRDALIKEREAAVLEREALIRQRERELDAYRSQGPQRRIVSLGRDALLVQLDFGGWIVVPTWNMDVAVALVRDGVIEPWTASAVRAMLRPGDTFLNVGVNLGYYLVAAAHSVERAGRVIGIEANRGLFPYLMRTVSWAGFPDTIRLFNCAASDTDGRWIETRYDPQYLGGMSIVEALRQPKMADRDSSRSKTLDSDRLEDALWENADLSALFAPSGEWKSTFSLFVKGRCQTKRIDTLLPHEPVHLMLLDIEGSEAAAILGAEQAIRRSPDLNIIMEWSPWYALRADNLAQTELMVGLLQELGYRFFRIRHEDFRAGHGPPALSPLPDKAALYATPHNDILISRDPDRVVHGWSERFVPI